MNYLVKLLHLDLKRYHNPRVIKMQ